jgi:hypothetical protein
MTKTMGRRLPISIDEGKKRPAEPVQAAKLASEAGVIIRDKYPILPHWKEYKKDKLLYKGFAGKLSVSALVFYLSLCIPPYHVSECNTVYNDSVAWQLMLRTNQLRKLS